jgi:hypothetical protein
VTGGVAVVAGAVSGVAVLAAGGAASGGASSVLQPPVSARERAMLDRSDHVLRWDFNE